MRRVNGSGNGFCILPFLASPLTFLRRRTPGEHSTLGGSSTIRFGQFWCQRTARAVVGSSGLPTTRKLAGPVMRSYLLLHKSRLLQLCVFDFGLLQDREIRV